MQRDSFILTLKSAKMITPSVRHLEFIPENKAFDFIPGQFITFHFEMDGCQHQRSYSIASIPGYTETIQVAASPFEGGPGTRLLFNMKPGETIETTGPFGRLILRDEQPQRYLLIATGTGVTPYRAMLPELLNRINEYGLKVVILLGVKSPKELLYGEDFLAFTREHTNLEFHICYSREMPKSPHPYEHKCYVQHTFTWLKPNPETDIVYLCGNPNMIDEAFTSLREQGFETKNVRREKYISPKK